MAQVSINLSFGGNAEEAFNHYKKAFKTEFSAPIRRFKDNPQADGVPKLSTAEGEKVTHVALPILGGLQIMGTDLLESYGQKLIAGNNFTINLGPDTNEEADRLYNLLAEGGTECIAPHNEFWGYYGCCKDRFGIRWIFNIIKQHQ